MGNAIMRCSIIVISALAAVVMGSAGCQKVKDGPIKTSGDKMARFEKPTASDIPELTKLFHSGDKNAREDAALALGTIGSPKCIDPIITALRDDDDSIRFNAMLGIERGIAAERATKEFLRRHSPHW